MHQAIEKSESVDSVRVRDRQCMLKQKEMYVEIITKFPCGAINAGLSRYCYSTIYW